MSEGFNGIAPKLSPLIRMLSSNGTGEIANAGRAIVRVLASAGLDIHALAERIEQGGDAQLSAAEMQKIYDAAYEKGFNDGSEHGRRSVILAGAQPMGVFAAPVDVGDGVNGYSWMQVAQHCAAHSSLFHGRDREFVESMPEKIAAFGRPTAKQAIWLRDLFKRRFGGRIE